MRNLQNFKPKNNRGLFWKNNFSLPQRHFTVDYFIVRQELINMCENLVVKEPTIFSDHPQLICWATISATASAPPFFEPQVQTFYLPKQFIWNEDSKEKFINVLKRDDLL